MRHTRIHCKQARPCLNAGNSKKIGTGNGVTIAYSHTTTFQIFHPASFDLVYTLDNILIDYLPNLEVVLLGAENFLSQFVLTLDYPNKMFSLVKSE